MFSFIKRYFENRRIRKNLKFFKNFLNNLEESFLYARKIPKHPENKLLYLETIKLKDEYINYVNKFNALNSKIESHNSLVNKAESFVNSFSLLKSIENIDNITDDEIKELYDVSINLSEIKFLYNNQEVFIKQVKELYENKKIIKEQFIIKKEVSKFFNEAITRNIYIDGKEALNIKNKLITAQDKINRYSKSYYVIEELNNFNQTIDDHNESYINNNLNNPLFDNVDNKSLGLDQRRAILTDSVSNLVVAGAGSGKTLTITGKAKWLLEDQGVKKNDIVFLSYSKASATDLEEKLNKISDNLNVSTFHSLGLKILQSENNIKQNVEENYDAIIERFFSDQMLSSQNSDIQRKILDFYARFAYSLPEEKHSNKGSLFEKLKESDFQTLKQILVNLSNNPDERETILKERVKSFEEMAIANFYFLNGINYRYEQPFHIDTASSEYRQYNPDFTLIDYNVYHEHYGVDKEGRSAQYSREEEINYLRTMKWKEEIHEMYNTNYIKSYSYEFKDRTIFDKLEESLKEFEIELKPISEEEVRNALSSVYKNRNFKSFIKLVKTFINLYKSRYPNNSYFETLKTETFSNAYEKQRAHLFLDIAKEIYDYYKSQLGDKIDFDDMILEAIRIIPTSKDFKYKYIVIDEFQDISYSRMQLLKTLIKHGNSKIFAVGDDWQSIYRFAGSDIGIFTKFDKYFEMSTECRLTNNFRNSKELHEIVEPFITTNPEQKRKDVYCNNELENPIKVVYYETNKEYALTKTLVEINNINPNASVLLLGRNNFDIEEYLSKTIKMYKNGIIRHSEFLNMNISFKTVHRSKGLEEEFVIVINNENSRTGFPNKIEDDPLLSLVLSDNSPFPYSEERRLFYVALTRTKSYCYLLVDVNRPSEFINEIEDKCIVVNPELSEINNNKEFCPECKTGSLTLRGEWGNQFYGCSNYPYCKYTQRKLVVESSKRCPHCKHFLVWREGPRGKFLGCTNYPKCRAYVTPRNLNFHNLKPNYNKSKKQ